MESCFGKDLSKFQEIIRSLCPDLRSSQSVSGVISEINQWVCSRDRQYEPDEHRALTELLIILHNMTIVAQATDSITTGIINDTRQLIYVIITSLPLEDHTIDPTNESFTQLKVKVALKLAKDSIGEGIPTKETVQCLRYAEEVLQLCLKRCGESSAPKTTIERLHRQLLVCHLYQAESYVGAKRYEKARNTYAKVQEKLTDFGDIKQYASHMCFNAGLLTYRQERYEESVHWLRQSFNSSQPSPSNCKSDDKSRILMLLANVYLSWNAKLHWQKAVSALDIIEKSQSYWDANFIKLRAYICGDVPANHIEQMATLCHQTSSDFSVEKAIAVTTLLKDSHHEDMALKVLKEMIVKFELNLDPNVDQLIEHQLRILLTEVDSREDIAEMTMRKYISTKQLQRHKSSWKSLENFFDSVETRAQTFKKKGNNERAIIWFNFCIDLRTCSDLHDTTGQFYQQICRCNIEMKRYADAGFALKSSENVAPNNVINDFLKLQLCIVGHLTEDIAPIMDAMIPSSFVKSRENPIYFREERGRKTVLWFLRRQLLIEIDYSDFLVCHAEKDDALIDDQSVTKEQVFQLILGLAEFSLKRGKDQMALEILESQFAKIKDTSMQLAVLKCIFKLKAGSLGKNSCDIEQHWLTTFAASLRDCFKQIPNKSGNTELVTKSGKLFAKMLWSVTQQRSNVDPLFIYTMLRTCNYILQESCGPDYSVNLQRQVFLLLALSFGLEFIRKNGINGSPEMLPEEILHSIEECKTLCASLSNIPHSSQMASTLSSTRQRLLVFEFEANLLLKLPDIDGLLERATRQSDVDAGTFEKFAAIVSLQKSDHYLLMVRCLRAAIQRWMKVTTPDYPRLLSLHRNLCHVILVKVEDGDVYGDDFGNFARELVKQVKEIPTQELTRTEVFWFVTRIWNVGIQRLFRDRSCGEANAWCRLALDLVDCIPTLSAVYKSKMNSILDNMEEPSGAHIACSIADQV